MTEEFVAFKGVEKTYFKAGVPSYNAIRSLDLEIRPGEFFCLLGPTGCGKTTVLNMLAGFEKPTAGSIELGGAPVLAPGRDRGVVFQGDDSLYSWLTAHENVEFGLKVRGVGRRERYECADRYMSLVGLRGQGHKHPRELSGGMKQRIQIARVLANDPAMLLMDEPFGALDSQTRRIMQRELHRIWRSTGKAVLFITHDVDEAILLGDRIGVMTAGPESSLKAIISVNIDWPRERSQPRFMECYGEVQALLEDEVSRALGTEVVT